jgi:hypothetical protein
MTRRAGLERAGLVLALTLVGVLGCAPESEAPADGQPWQQVFGGLSQALLSVWGTSSSDVWAVGSDVADGTGPLVLRYDGSGWTRLPTGDAGDLWWVFGFAAGPVLLGGSGGRILRYQGGAFEAQTTPGTSTVYGIWGARPDDVWAVGGDGAAGAFAWHFDGGEWSDVSLPGELRDTTSLFKVWGRAQDDVWFVGTRGTILHHDGQAFSEEPSPSPAQRDLFTVHGNAERVVAVGGSGDGLIVENDGSGFHDVTPRGASVLQLAGVHLTEQGGWAVGDYGSVLVREIGGFRAVDLGLDVVQTFHSVWADPDGGVWAVGGEVSTLPLTDGVMVHQGKAVTGDTYE